MNWKECRRKKSWPNLKHYFDIHLTEVRKIFSQKGRFVARHLNPGPPKYEAVEPHPTATFGERSKYTSEICMLCYGVQYPRLLAMCFASATFRRTLTVSHLTNAVIRVVMFVYLQWSTRRWNVIDGFVCVWCVWLYTISNTDHITEMSR
jgi:hypothetical protein